MADTSGARRRLPGPVGAAVATGVVTLAIALAAAWWFLIRPADGPDLPTVSLNQLLAVGAGDDWHWSALEGADKVYVVEYPSLAAQGQALNRIATLIEKAGAPRDRVLSDKEMAAFMADTGANPITYYYGHDYRAEDLARFFTLAAAQHAPLNAAETRLRGFLIEARLIEEDGGAYLATDPPGAIVSYSRAQTDDPATAIDEGVPSALRAAVLRHELSHGVYFTNAAYREHSWNFWRGLNAAEKDMFITFLAGEDYDPLNEDLMVNEVQAFLVHTPEIAFSAAHLGIAPQQLNVLRNRFLQDLPPIPMTPLFGAE